MKNFYEHNKDVIDEYLEKIGPVPKEDIDEEFEEDAEFVLVRDFIYYFSKSEKRKPFIDEVIRGTRLTKNTVLYVIDTLGLEDEIDKTFNSKFVSDIYNRYAGASANREDVVPNIKLDLYYKEFNIAINIVCSYENDVTTVDKRFTQLKTLQANTEGIRLIHIFDYEMLDDIVASRIYRMLDDIFNKPIVTVGARHTKIRVIDYGTARDFLNEYHIQGTATATVYLGSYLKDELIGVMTFGKPRFSKGYDYEVVRLAWKTGVRVAGGTQKIFSYFIKNFNPQSIMTYADINKFTGNGYLKIGFKFMQVTEPDYKWVSYDSKEALTRYKCQKHRLLAKGWGIEEQTEDQIMMSHQYYKVYGSGNITLDWVNGRTLKNEDKEPIKLSETPNKAKKSVSKKAGQSVCTLNKFI